MGMFVMLKKLMWKEENSLSPLEDCLNRI